MSPNNASCVTVPSNPAMLLKSGATGIEREVRRSKYDLRLLPSKSICSYPCTVSADQSGSTTVAEYSAHCDSRWQTSQKEGGENDGRIWMRCCPLPNAREGRTGSRARFAEDPITLAGPVAFEVRAIGRA